MKDSVDKNGILFNLEKYRIREGNEIGSSDIF